MVFGGVEIPLLLLVVFILIYFEKVLFCLFCRLCNAYFDDQMPQYGRFLNDGDLLFSKANYFRETFQNDVQNRLAQFMESFAISCVAPPFVKNKRGNVYYGLKQYTRALELDPNYALAYSNRGAVYNALKDYQAALSDYTRALVLYPTFVNAYGGRGLAYYYLQDYQHAVQDFDRALQLDPNITWFKSERDNAYRRLKRR